MILKNSLNKIVPLNLANLTSKGLALSIPFSIRKGLSQQKEQYIPEGAFTFSSHFKAFVVSYDEDSIYISPWLKVEMENSCYFNQVH